jgi:hypothetical protein
MTVLGGLGYYAIDDGSEALYSFALFTGTSTFIGLITGTAPDVQISGLAAAAVPAPATGALLGLGLLAGALARRRRD